jgi:phosphatidate cytidylyltransferase
MILQLYYIILGLFLLGAVLMAIILIRRPDLDKKKSWTKYAGYFFIVNVLIATVVFLPKYFIYLAILILAFGWYELLQLARKSKNKTAFGVAIILYLFLNFTFLSYALLPKAYLFMGVFLVNIFDAFSQLSGQLLGRKKILPRISPNKTLEGLVGGFIFTLLAALYLKQDLPLSLVESLVVAAFIAVFSFTGDLLASLLKRISLVKDYSNILPGQGGFLDRFDSLIFTSAFFFMLSILGVI